MDYGKFKYEAAQKAKESRRKSTNVVVKEMKYRPKIGGGDFGTKTRKVEQFLDEGHKVKITIMFRGREVAHPELGRKILDQVAEAVEHTGKVEVYPKLDGPRNMIMVLAPDKRAQADAKKKAQTDAAEASAAQAAEGSAPVDEAPVADAAAVEAPVAEAPVAESPAPEAPIETPEAPASEPVEAETEA